jgi:hypothetical protein
MRWFGDTLIELENKIKEKNLENELNPLLKELIGIYKRNEDVKAGVIRCTLEIWELLS